MNLRSNRHHWRSAAIFGVTVGIVIDHRRFGRNGRLAPMYRLQLVFFSDYVIRLRLCEGADGCREPKPLRIREAGPALVRGEGHRAEVRATDPRYGHRGQQRGRSSFSP